MAYLAFQEFAATAAARAIAAPAAAAIDAGRLTRLEWTVVDCARRDGRRSLRGEGRWDRLVRGLTGRPNPRLADPRLEALRRMAVLAWADGYTVPAYEVRAFLSAGFTTRQYETLVDRISAARILPPRTANRG